MFRLLTAGWFESSTPKKKNIVQAVKGGFYNASNNFGLFIEAEQIEMLNKTINLHFKKCFSSEFNNLKTLRARSLKLTKKFFNLDPKHLLMKKMH